MPSQDSTTPRLCAECGTSFNAKTHNAKYCCIKCKKRANYFGNITREKARRQAHREANRERLAQEAREYRAGNREAVLARARERRAANVEKYRAECRLWAAQNPDKMREYRKRNRERLNARHREYCRKRYATDASFREKERARTQARRPWRLKRSDVSRVYDAQNGECAACGSSIADGYHLDHVIPQSRGGPSTLANLQLLCAPCNISKSNRLAFFPNGKQQGILVLARTD